MQQTVTILVAMLCIVSFRVSGQFHSISGHVKDKSGKAVASATVSLLKASDSSWVQTEITNDDGSYKMQEVVPGDYILAVSSITTVEKTETISMQEKDLLHDMEVMRKSNALEEVTVTGNKPFIERRADMLVANISADKALGNNVLDLLRKLPGLKVNSDGSISMTGKQGVLVLVNGRQTYLSGEELANYLRSMTAEQVAQVEIMSQPTARYDAEGNTGIVNIKTHKNHKEGLSGSASATYSQTRYSGTSDNVRVGYKREKTNLSVNAGYYNRAGFLDQRIDRTLKDKNTGEQTGTMEQESYLFERFKDYSLSVDGEREIDSTSAINIHASGNYHPNNETDLTSTHIYDISTATVTNNEFENNRDFVRTNFNGVAQYSKKIKPNHEFTVNADYNLYNVDNYQDLVNNNYNAQMQPVPGGVSLKGYLPTDIEVFSSKADYNGTVGKTQIEGGVKASFVAIDAGVFFDVEHSGTWIPDTVRSNNFLYNENVNAAYFSCSRSLGTKVETKMGLRAEQTNAKGFQEIGNISFERHYISLFPTAYVSYKPNDKYSFGCNYGRRLQRPEYRQMNPYVEYYSQYNVRTGNPALRPQFTHAIELNGSYKNTVHCNASYRSVSDIINNVARQDNKTFIYYVMPENIAKNTAYEFALTFNKELFKWWEVSATGYSFYLDYDGIYDGMAFSNGGPGWGFMTSGDLSFNKWKASYWLNANGRSRESSIVTASANMMYGFSVSRRVFHDTTLIKLNVVDPFLTYVYDYNVIIQDVDTHARNVYNTREYALSITYDFGKQIDRMRQIARESDETGRMRM